MHKPAMFMVASGVFWLVGGLVFAPLAQRHLGFSIAQNLCFFVGAIAAAAGVSMLVAGLNDGRGRRLGMAGRSLLWLATVAWGMLFFRLIAVPLGVGFATRIVARTMWMSAALLTLAAFVLIGLALIASRTAVIAGAWMAAASALLFCGAIAMRSDLPPLLFFQVLLIAGLALMLRRPALTT
jgi:hypothetical protein